MNLLKILVGFTLLFLLSSIWISNQISVGYLISITIYLAVILTPLILAFNLIKRSANPKVYYFFSLTIFLSFILIWIATSLFPPFLLFEFKMLCPWPPPPKGTMLCGIYNFIDLYISSILFILPAWFLFLRAEKLRTKRGTSLLAILTIIVGIIITILTIALFVSSFGIITDLLTRIFH